MKDKLLVAGIDIVGGDFKLAYWYKGIGEPQIFEDEAERTVSHDILEVMSHALSELGVGAFASVCIVVASLLNDVVVYDMCRRINAAYPETKVKVISRGESAAHYSLNQKKELRVNDVAFFDLDESGLLYNRLHTVTTNGRINALVENRDCSDIISLEKLEGNETSAMDECFKNLINELFEKQHISTVYLTGKGFANEEWAKDSLNMLCNKRRVFKGENLYVIGACYFSAWGYFSDINDEYGIVCEGRTMYETCLEVIYKEERREAVLIPAGRLYRDIGRVMVEGIISGDEVKLVFIKRPMFGKEVVREEIRLDVKKFGDRMLRLEVDLQIVNGRELMARVTDIGFGEFAGKTGVIVEKIIGNA